MHWTIPGTTITVPESDQMRISDRFAGLFLAGGLTLSQISAITGLEGYVIQNWTRRGFLLPPVGRKYDLAQLCRIATLNAVKDALPLEQICRILDHSGADMQAYFLFAEQIRGRGAEEGIDEKMQLTLDTLQNAWQAAEMIRKTNEIFARGVQTQQTRI